MYDNFVIIKKNGNIYRKNRNTTGKCIHYSELRCVCCNPDCVYNCSIDDDMKITIE